jgi:hypothetical protein
VFADALTCQLKAALLRAPCPAALSCPCLLLRPAAHQPARCVHRAVWPGAGGRQVARHAAGEPLCGRGRQRGHCAQCVGTQPAWCGPHGCICTGERGSGCTPGARVCWP